jgi:hypothetical protein
MRGTVNAKHSRGHIGDTNAQTQFGERGAALGGCRFRALVQAGFLSLNVGHYVLANVAGPVTGRDHGGNVILKGIGIKNHPLAPNISMLFCKIEAISV